MSYGPISPPWWSEVWIVACGPSAGTFDLDRLKGRTVLAVNSACYLFSPYQLQHMDLTLFSGDPDWVRGNRASLQYHSRERYVCVALDTNPDLGDIRGVTHLQRLHADGLSEAPTHLAMGGNSGYAAVNLAYLKAAKEIHLVGYDMDASRGADAAKFSKWIPKFRTMLPQLAAKGVRVINHNPNSSIDAFEKTI